MADETNIEWAQHTGGPYLGCGIVTPGCWNCYAMLLAMTRLEPIFRKAYRAAGLADWETRPVWGPKAPRVLTKGFWRDARRINKAHAKAGTRGRWFPSLIDWLDEMPAGIIDQAGNWLKRAEVLGDFLELVHETPHLDWLLLTKRPEQWRARMEDVLQSWEHRAGGAKAAAAKFPAYCIVASWTLGRAPGNVWIGATAEDQRRADERVGQVLKIPADVRFLSVEPMLGPVDLRLVELLQDASEGSPMIHWVICGGESGPKARLFNPVWAASLMDQCGQAGVAFFMKQMGGNLSDAVLDNFAALSGKSMHDPKGGDPSEWPEAFRVRELPEGAGL